MNTIIWNPKGNFVAELGIVAGVRPTSYMEVHELIGTSGCSNDGNLWAWSILGVVDTPRGKLVVYPGDTLVEVQPGLFIPDMSADAKTRISLSYATVEASQAWCEEALENAKNRYKTLQLAANAGVFKNFTIIALPKDETRYSERLGLNIRNGHLVTKIIDDLTSGFEVKPDHLVGYVFYRPEEWDIPGIRGKTYINPECTQVSPEILSYVSQLRVNLTENGYFNVLRSTEVLGILGDAIKEERLLELIGQ